MAHPDVLPLKLNAFERYMWADDRPAHPMSFFVQVRYSGQLDESALARALEQTLPRHPLLRARIAGSCSRDLRWVASPDLRPYCDCADAATPMHFPGDYRIDLRQENGLRIWVRRGHNGGVIRLQFHHSCCDGIAANQLVDDLLRVYDRVTGERAHDPVPLPDVNFTRLSRRNWFGEGCWDWLGRRVVDVWGMVAGSAILLLTRPTPLQTWDATANQEQPGGVVPDLLTWRFTAVQLASLLAKCRRARVTLNDLLLRDVFMSLHAWNRNHDRRLERGLIRIMVPFNLRGPEHQDLPAVNVVGMANLDRRMHRPWHRSAQRLLRGICLETWFLKKFRMVTCFPSIVWVLGGLPGGMHRYLSPDRCLATCVVSNLGRIFVETPLRQDDGRIAAGKLIVEAIDTAPPVRGGSGAALTFYTYAGQLSVSLNYDAHRLLRPTAERLLHCIVAQIKWSADAPPSGGS